MSRSWRQRIVRLALISLVVLVSTEGRAAPSVVPPLAQEPGTVYSLDGASLADAERLFAEADAAVYLPDRGVVRVFTSDSSPRDASASLARSGVGLRTTLLDFAADARLEIAEARRPYLLKLPSFGPGLFARDEAIPSPLAAATLPLRDSFDGGLSDWTLGDNSSGRYAWGATTCEARSGSRSADAVRGGTTALACADPYAPSVTTNMLHTACEPLSGTSQAFLDFYMHPATENGEDILGVYYGDAAGDGWGYAFSGSSTGWFHVVLNLKQWYRIGDVTALSCPKLFVQFSADSSIQPGFGVRIDDLTIAATAPTSVSCAIQASPTQGAAPLTVSFSPVASGASSSATYLWSFGDSAGSTSSQKNASFTYTAPGDYWVRLRVDDPGVRAYAHQLIRVTQAGSSCSLSCSATAPTSGGIGAALAFAATASTTGCTGAPTYAWSFGDGATSTQQSASHAYAAAGTFGWSVTVAIAGGQPCVKSGSVTITAPQDPCTGPKTGDCDGDGKVSPAELQKAVNMYLGKSAAACNVDVDRDGKVSLDELQRAVNATLDVAAGGAGGVTVAPASVTLQPGARQTFRATAVLCGNTSSVTWSVQEGAAGGTVTTDGVYTAPTSPGTYHVVASAAADASKKAVATVAVLAAPQTLKEVTVSPSSSDQTIDVPGKVSVVIPGGYLSASAKVAVQEVAGLPTPPSLYQVRTPWFRIAVNGVDPAVPLPVVIRNGTSGTGEAFALQYIPPVFRKVPGSPTGGARAAVAAGPLDLDITYTGGTVAGASAVLVGTGQEEKVQKTLHFEIYYYVKLGSGPALDVVPDATTYAAKNSADPAVPDFVEDVASFLEAAYTLFTDATVGMGLTKPNVKAVSIGAYDSSQWSTKTGRIYIANSPSGSAGTVPWWAALKWECGHELFHAVENQYRTIFGMYAVSWFTEGLAEYAASRALGGPEARSLLDVHATNSPDWLRYIYWTSDGGMQETMLYMSGRLLDYVFSHGGLSPSRTMKDLMTADYGAAYSSAGAADHLLETFTNFGSSYTDYVKFFYFDDGSPLASLYGGARSARNNDAPKSANRLAYDDGSIGERELTLGGPGGFPGLTADYVALFPSAKSVVAKAGLARVFFLEMLTELREQETATLYLGKQGRIVDQMPMMPKGKRVEVVLGANEKSDSAYVLVVSTAKSGAGSGAAHRLRVSADDSPSSYQGFFSYRYDIYKTTIFEMRDEVTVSSDTAGGFTRRADLEIPELVPPNRWFELPPYNGTNPQRVRVSHKVSVSVSGGSGTDTYRIDGYSITVTDSTRSGVQLPEQENGTVELVTRPNTGTMAGGGAAMFTALVRQYNDKGVLQGTWKVSLPDVAFIPRPQ